MRVSRVACALGLVAAVGCDGPALVVGEHRIEFDASAASDDARVVDGNAGRPRDAQSDAELRFPWNQGQFCMTSRQCSDNPRDNPRNIRCHPDWHVCVECFNDDQCRPGRCNEEFLQCRDSDRPRP